MPNCSLSSDSKLNNRSTSPGVLDAFEEEEWETSVNSSLPTEFDLRPDLTPTGDEPNTISFETPIVRSSPSQLSHNKSSEEDIDDSDETLEQVSEIVDQTPSTYQAQKDSIVNKKKSENAQGKNSRKISCGKRLCVMLCTSVLSALIIIITLTCLIILILENDSEFFNEIRKLPEIVIFEKEYYQPLKENILQSFN